MDAELDTDPAPKKAKTEPIDQKTCVFCGDAFSDKQPAVSPVISKLDSLFSACEQRAQLGDKVAQNLLANKSDICSAKVTFRYHRDCRSTFVSKLHVQRAKECTGKSLNVGAGSSGGVSSDSGGEDIRRFTRSNTADFDWKSHCFICGDVCSTKHRSSWSVVASSISEDPHDPNMYTRVLAAAKARQDDNMLARLAGVPNGDLVAVEARYHRSRSCYINYVGKRVITATQKRQQDEAYSSSVKTLIGEFSSPILEHNQVFFLSTLRKRFLEILAEEGVDNPDVYRSQHLKRQLLKEWSEVAFIPQSGKSHLVCSRNITVGHALSEAHELSQVLREVAEEYEAEIDTEIPSTSDACIIHQAIGILRRGFLDVSKLEDEYYSPEEMSVESLQKFVDPLLYKALGWLTDEKLCAEAADIADVEPPNSKCLNIACDIVTLATSVASPKHLGLAARLHHDYGSRQLVDDMYHMGYSVSYTEVRRFETSAAQHVCDQQICTPSAAYIPPEITPRDRGGQLIVVVADNWDHNERTTDGKRTTHAFSSSEVVTMVTQNHLGSNVDHVEL